MAHTGGNGSKKFVAAQSGVVTVCMRQQQAQLAMPLWVFLYAKYEMKNHYEIGLITGVKSAYEETEKWRTTRPIVVCMG